MASNSLEGGISMVGGADAAAVVNYALARCHPNRYSFRSRREELLGDLLESWQDFEAAVKRSRSVLTQARSTSLRQSLRDELEEAKDLCHRLIGTLASCIPVGSGGRLAERAERFVRNVISHPDIKDLLIELEDMSQSLATAVSYSLGDQDFQETRPPLSRAGHYSDDSEYGREDDYTRHRYASSAGRCSPLRRPSYDDGPYRETCFRDTAYRDSSYGPPTSSSPLGGSPRVILVAPRHASQDYATPRASAYHSSIPGYTQMRRSHHY
ncbi:MAG: hypothetical protein M1838_005730 [Thelocarpon superellum]|nr:MAG: hypothetical protein M1838_005730 [Thelocarpon superellum]